MSRALLMIFSFNSQEAGECIEELKSPTFHHLMVENAINDTLEKNLKQRTLVGKLLNYLIKQNITPINEVVKG